MGPRAEGRPINSRWPGEPSERGLHRGGGHDPGRAAGGVPARPHGGGRAGRPRGRRPGAARRPRRLGDEPRGVRRRGELRLPRRDLSRPRPRAEPPGGDGDILRRGRALRRVRGDRGGIPPARAGRRRGEDDAPLDAPGLRADRPVDRPLRALVRRDDAGAGGHRDAGVDGAERRHAPGHLARGRQEPRQRRPEPARPLPGDGHARGGPGEPAHGGPAAPLSLLPDLRRRGGRRRAGGPCPRPDRGHRAGVRLPRAPLPGRLHRVPRDAGGGPGGVPDGRFRDRSGSRWRSSTTPSRPSS